MGFFGECGLGLGLVLGLGLWLGLGPAPEFPELIMPSPLPWSELPTQVSWFWIIDIN